jgi:predicted metallopeptidase
VLAPETLEDRFKSLENEDKVELMLNEIKSRQLERQSGAGAGNA